MPRMIAVLERWVGTCRRELLDRMLIWNQAHLLDALREFETHCIGHTGRWNRKHHCALRRNPSPPAQTSSSLDVRRRDRLGGILHEYEHAA